MGKPVLDVRDAESFPLWQVPDEEYRLATLRHPKNVGLGFKMRSYSAWPNISLQFVPHGLLDDLVPLPFPVDSEGIVAPI